MKQSTIIGIGSVALIVAVLIGGVILIGQKESGEEMANDTKPSQNAGDEQTGAFIPEGDVTELVITDLEEGTGEVAAEGKSVTVHYRGTLASNGQEFDASYNRGTPFTFTLGAGEVIAGWDLGVSGMKVGGKRRLVIPSDLAYGSRGAGGVIGPNADLVFEVELLAVE